MAAGIPRLWQKLYAPRASKTLMGSISALKMNDKALLNYNSRTSMLIYIKDILWLKRKYTYIVFCRPGNG